MVCIPSAEGTEDPRWDIVFIDFAFTLMPLGEGGIEMCRADGDRLQFCLYDKMDPRLVIRCWDQIPQLDEEDY